MHSYEKINVAVPLKWDHKKALPATKMNSIKGGILVTIFEVYLVESRAWSLVHSHVIHTVKNRVK
jgi:hypothetical protein